MIHLFLYRQLGQNRLSYLPEDVFTHTPSLTYLYDMCVSPLTFVTKSTPSQISLWKPVQGHKQQTIQKPPQPRPTVSVVVAATAVAATVAVVAVVAVVVVAVVAAVATVVVIVCHY